jgi:hypothetical protein
MSKHHLTAIDSGPGYCIGACHCGDVLSFSSPAMLVLLFPQHAKLKDKATLDRLEKINAQLEADIAAEIDGAQARLDEAWASTRP